MPGPVGPNPALTIAANADRIVERVLENAPAGRRADEADVTDSGTAPADPLDGDSVQFTEQMKGFLALGETDPVEGWTRARLPTGARLPLCRPLITC